MESSESHGDDTSGETPITIQVNSGGNSIHDDTSSYHTGPFRNQFNPFSTRTYHVYGHRNFENFQMISFFENGSFQ